MNVVLYIIYQEEKKSAKKDLIKICYDSLKLAPETNKKADPFFYKLESDIDSRFWS